MAVAPMVVVVGRGGVGDVVPAGLAQQRDQHPAARCSPPNSAASAHVTAAHLMTRRWRKPARSLVCAPLASIAASGLRSTTATTTMADAPPANVSAPFLKWVQKAVERVLGVSLVPSTSGVYLESAAQEQAAVHGGLPPPQAYWSLGESLLFDRLQTPTSSPETVIDYIISAYKRTRAEEARARRMPPPDKEAGLVLMARLRTLLAGYVRMAIEDPEAWAFPSRSVSLPNGHIASVPSGPYALVPTLMNLSPFGATAVADWAPDARWRATQPQSKRDGSVADAALSATAGWEAIAPEDVHLFLSDLIIAAGVPPETPHEGQGSNEGSVGDERFEDLAPILGPAITLIAQRIAGPPPPPAPKPPQFPGRRGPARQVRPSTAQTATAGLAPEALQAAVQAGDVRSVLAHLLAGRGPAGDAGAEPMDVDDEESSEDDEYDEGYGDPSSTALLRTEAILRQQRADHAGPSAKSSVDGFALDSLAWRPYASVLVALAENKLLAEMVCVPPKVASVSN